MWHAARVVRLPPPFFLQLAQLRESIDHMSSESADVTRAVKQLEAEGKDADMWMAGVDKRVESMLRQATAANDTLVQVQDAMRNLVSAEQLEAVGKAAVEPALKRVVQAATREMERLGSRLTDDTRAAVAERVAAAVGAEEALLAEVEAMRQRMQEVRARWRNHSTAFRGAVRPRAFTDPPTRRRPPRPRSKPRLPGPRLPSVPP